MLMFKSENTDYVIASVLICSMSCVVSAGTKQDHQLLVRWRIVTSLIIAPYK